MATKTKTKPKKPSMKDALQASVKNEMTSKAAKLDKRFAAAEALTATHGEAGQGAKVEQTPAPKVVRDTFSMPEDDFQLLEKLRSRARKMDLDTNKSELVRAGLRLLADLDDVKLERLIRNVDKLKPGPRAKA